MTKQLYIIGAYNYKNYEKGLERFNKIVDRPSVLELREKGLSSIVFLSDEPIYVGQPVYVGVDSKYNEAAKKLMKED